MLNEADAVFCVQCGHIMPIRESNPAPSGTTSPEPFKPEVPEGFYMGEDGEIYPIPKEHSSYRVNLTKPDKEPTPDSNNTGFVDMRYAYQNENPGYQNTGAGYQNTDAGYQNTGAGYQNTGAYYPEGYSIRQATSHGVHFGGAIPPSVPHYDNRYVKPCAREPCARPMRNTVDSPHGYYPVRQKTTSAPGVMPMSQYSVQFEPVVVDKTKISSVPRWNRYVDTIRAAIVGRDYSRARTYLEMLTHVNFDFYEIPLENAINTLEGIYHTVCDNSQRNSRFVSFKIAGFSILGIISGSLMLSAFSDVLLDVIDFLRGYYFSLFGSFMDLAIASGLGVGTVACILKIVKLSKSKRFSTYNAHDLDLLNRCEQDVLSMVDSLYAD